MTATMHGSQEEQQQQQNPGRHGADLLALVRNPFLTVDELQLQVSGWLRDGPVDWNFSSVDGLSAMHLAAQQGLMAVLQCLIEHGANVDCRDVLGQTPAHFAAARGHVEMLRVLAIVGGADLSAKTNDGQTPLDWSLEEGLDDVANLICELLRTESDVEAQGPHAVHSDITANEDIRQSLYATNSTSKRSLRQPVFQNNAQERTARGRELYRACACGDWDSALRVLRQCESDGQDLDVHWSDGSGKTAIHWASWAGMKAIESRLIAHGATPLSADATNNNIG